jgi:hypothetical protein
MIPVSNAVGVIRARRSVLLLGNSSPLQNVDYTGTQTSVCIGESKGTANEQLVGGGPGLNGLMLLRVTG